jgi:hypothetical protein
MGYLRLICALETKRESCRGARGRGGKEGGGGGGKRGGGGKEKGKMIKIKCVCVRTQVMGGRRGGRRV